MQRKAKSIALCAVLVALTAVFGAIPYAFLIPVLLAAVTTDFKTSFVVSTFFGVVSLLYSLMGGSVVAVAFVANPWIPIVGRIFVGPAARGAYVLVNKAIKKEGKLKSVLPRTVGAAVGSLANTVIVVSLLVLFAPNAGLEETTVIVYVPIMLISGAIEFAVNVLCVPPIALAVDKVRTRNGG